MKERKKIDLSKMSTEEALYFFGLVTLPIGLISVWLVVNLIVPHFKGGCIFYELLGVYCPGCGGTRALIALAHGHVVQSAWYHPLLLYCVVMYLAFMLSHTLEKLHVPFVKGMKFRAWICYGMIVVIVLNCVLKNVLKFAFGIPML